MTIAPISVRRLPETNDPASHRSFLREIRAFMDNAREPRLIVDLSAVQQIPLESIDLLLECVEQAERSDGQVSVTGLSDETAVMLELTQATSVLNVFPSVLEAANGCQPQAD
jgi:anti-anti-sigma regulatory factor